jgi:hypothetical protein
MLHIKLQQRNPKTEYIRRHKSHKYKNGVLILRTYTYDVTSQPYVTEREFQYAGHGMYQSAWTYSLFFKDTCEIKVQCYYNLLYNHLVPI